MAGEYKIFQPPFFCPPFNLAEKNHPCYYFVKLFCSKAFTTFLLACKKHTQDAETRPFCPGFCLKSLSFLSFSEKCKNQCSFCKCLIINKVCFCTEPAHGGRYENGACFYQPHFCLKKLPSKFLPCKLTLWGEEVKMRQIFIFPQWSIGIFTDILPSKIINSYRGNGGR